MEVKSIVCIISLGFKKDSGYMDTGSTVPFVVLYGIKHIKYLYIFKIIEIPNEVLLKYDIHNSINKCIKTCIFVLILGEITSKNEMEIY